MATISKQMYNGAAATNSATLYTTPSSTTAVVTNFVIANTANTAGTFNIFLGGTSIATNEAIPANTTVIFDLKQVLNATQTIAGYASATSINFLVSGVEIS